jgi:hypothetical protein
MSTSQPTTPPPAGLTRSAPTRGLARPLKVLIPLIATALRRGEEAALVYYREAGELLNEARSQVSHGRWGAWLSKHFKETGLSQATAYRYMRYAKIVAESDTSADQNSHGEKNGRPAGLKATIGAHRRRPRDPDTVDGKAYHTILNEAYARLNEAQAMPGMQEWQRQAEESAHKRKLAEEVIQRGYKAVAQRLHPDRGGDQNAMARLNDVRDALLAKTKRGF